MKAKFVVITGGPGVGKTTLLQQLAKMGFSYVPEVAREIIKEEVNRGGMALPWADREAFAQLMFEWSIASESKVRILDKPIDILFFDRGLLDILSYVHMCGLTGPKELMTSIQCHPYFQKVFLLPPWREIYATDNERKQDFQEALTTDEWLRKTYQKFGYDVVDVPKTTAAERASFVLSQLQDISPV